MAIDFSGYIGLLSLLIDFFIINHCQILLTTFPFSIAATRLRKCKKIRIKYGNSKDMIWYLNITTGPLSLHLSFSSATFIFSGDSYFRSADVVVCLLEKEARWVRTSLSCIIASFFLLYGLAKLWVKRASKIVFLTITVYPKGLL